MFQDADFWKSETDSPLMLRNAGYVTADNAAERCAEVRGLLDFVPASFIESMSATKKDGQEATGNDEMDRIFYQDAVRTFTAEKFRQQEVKALNALYGVIDDYHQGLGFVIAFLLLFLSHDDAVTLALYLDKVPLKGYFKIHNEGYLRDARVFERLLLNVDPELGHHLQDLTVPGQYCSKWFIGMNVHVFPFEAIVRWLTLLICKGEIQLFKLGLAIMERNREYLLKCKDTAKIIELLRFDRKAFPDTKLRHSLHVDGGVEEDRPGSFYLDMVERSLGIEVDATDVAGLRDTVEEEMRQEDERRRIAQAAAADSDDEIVFSDEEE